MAVIVTEARLVVDDFLLIRIFFNVAAAERFLEFRSVRGIQRCRMSTEGSFTYGSISTSMSSSSRTSSTSQSTGIKRGVKISGVSEIVLDLGQLCGDLNSCLIPPVVTGLLVSSCLCRTLWEFSAWDLKKNAPRICCKQITQTRLGKLSCS